MVKIAINGFGRIGRQVFRKITENYPDLEIIAVNDLTDAKTLAHLLKYDSIYGKYDRKLDCKIFAEENPEELPWKDLGVDIVLECTGFFTDSKGCQKHIKAGAKKVIISAPSKDPEVPTFILGVNEDDFDPKKHDIMDMGSCTTNCLAPVAKVLQDNFKIKRGFITTTHSYTNDQKILDLPHKDLRRARAAALNIIPTSTGAAKAIGKAISELQGKLDGVAFRVPTPTVSILDLVIETEKEVSIESINSAFEKAEKEKGFKGILRTEKEPLVSSDYKGDTYSSIVDLPLTMASGNLAKVVAWYDNEAGYSSRLADFAEFVGKKMK
jgi:glyceraldehyde 3-phosphate dehydrogenase